MPIFSLCSGRSLPYVEAMTQVPGIQVPVLFEAGAGRYDPETARVTWHPDFTVEVEDAITQVPQWMIRECLPGSSLMFDYSKRTQSSIRIVTDGCVFQGVLEAYRWCCAHNEAVRKKAS